MMAAVASERLDSATTQLDDLLREIPLRARVLEIGCGTGHVARQAAAKRGARVTAVDASANMIAVARACTAASLGIDFRIADVMALSPRGFDVVLCVDTLSELPQAAACAHMARAVVPGGQVMIVDHAPSWFMGPLRRELREALPGVAIRRRGRGRYSAVWFRR